MMKYNDLKTLVVTVGEGVAFAAIDNGEINLLDLALLSDLIEFARRAEADDEVRVIVFESANPDFFIAHADVNLLLHRRTQPPALDDPNFNTICAQEEQRPFQMMTEAFRKMPKPSIAKIDGIVRGGGLEFVAALDMRFCSPRARLAQPELGLSLVPGGGAMTRWKRLIGGARAAEIMLVCDDISGEMAERYGMVNRVIHPDDPLDLDQFVLRAAERIARFSPDACARIKEVIQMEASIDATMIAGSCAFDQTIRSEETLLKIKDFLARGGQTRDYELGPLVR